MNNVIHEMMKGLTETELKILYVAVYGAGVIEEKHIYNFSIKKFCDMCGLSVKGNRSHIIDAFKKIDMVSYRSTAVTGGIRIKWFDELSYEIRGDIISYSFFEEIIPYLNVWFYERMNAFLSPEAAEAIFSGFGGENGKE